MLTELNKVLLAPDDALGGGADASTPTPNTDADAFDGTDLTQLPPAAQRYIKELRAEAAERRKQLTAFTSEAQKREQERLISEGKWKELAESRERDLMQLKPYQERADGLEGIIKAQNDARITAVPEEMRTIIPTDYAPEKLSTWLDANIAKLTRQPAPNLDAGAGAGSGGKPSPVLTDQELAIARMLGISPEVYAKNK
jgi:phage I-like protein